MKLFLDTNVLVAACLEEHEHHGRALPLVQTIHEKKVEGFASAHTLLEMLATLTRLPRSPRILPMQAATLLEENVMKRFSVVSLTAKEYAELARRLGREGIIGGQAYDALHLECARKSGADRIYTFNVRHFQSLADDTMRPRIVSP